MNKYGLRGNCLKDAPLWLKKWSSIILLFIEFEEQLYPKFFKKELKGTITQQDLAIEAKNWSQQQVQNIIITLNKVIHVLKLMNIFEPPIKTMSDQEKFYKVWLDQNSIRAQLRSTLQKIEHNHLIEAVLRLLDTNLESESKNYKSLFNKARQIFLEASKILRPLKSNEIQVDALCDILIMYSQSENLFCQNENYKKCAGQQI